MEFWLGLSDEEKQRQIVRQRRLRRVFWALGATLVVVQVVALLLPKTAADETGVPTQVQVALLPSATATALPTATPTPRPPTSTPPPTPAPTETPTTVPLYPATGQNERKTPVALLMLRSPPKRVIEERFVLAGTGRPGDLVSVLYRQSSIAQAEVDQLGDWLVEIPTEPLDHGENVLSVRSESTSGSIRVTITFAPWWLPAPARLQGALGEGYACAPTVLGVAMDYYHTQDPVFAAPATIEIVEALKREGFVEGYGADARMLVNLAISYGYSHSFFYRSWTQAHLRKMLDEGTPVIANVRVDMTTDGYGHSVLVIGMSPDGKRVMVIDPAQGMVTYPWTVFEASWGSFGPPYHHGLVVKP